MGRRLSKLASEYTHWVWSGNVPLHEWNSGREWKDDGWQHYELDLKTWAFEEESFVPMELLLNGKVYSIVTDQGGGIVYSKVGKKTGYVDKFGNVWVKGPTRTNGEEFEWDVQLTKTRVELFKRSGLSSDGKHLNVSLQGRITH